MRTTKKDLAILLSIFIKRLKQPGRQFHLDYAACYGGYQIEEYLPNGQLANSPFGLARLKASDMETALRFAIRALEMSKEPEREGVKGDYYNASN